MATKRIKAKEFCFHCGDKKKQLTKCERWEVSACIRCITKYHATNHDSCEIEPEDSTLKQKEGAQVEYFEILLTRIDQTNVKVLCKKGNKLKMEEHWAGTYIYSAASVILVLETKDAINERILQGLRSISL